MKLSIQQTELVKALSIVGRAVPNQTPLAICKCVLLTATAEGLTLTATNLEQTITLQVGATVHEPGQAAIPAKLLAEVVASLPAERVDMEMRPSNILGLACGSYRTQINGLSSDDFPSVAVMTGQEAVVILNGAELKIALSHALVSVAEDDSRPALAGLYMALSGPEVTLVSTNGYTLSLYRLLLRRPVDEELTLLVPGQAMSELAHILKDVNDPAQAPPVELYAAPNTPRVGFRVGAVQLVSQLIEANFPDYRQLIPTSMQARVCMPVRAFKEAVKTARIFAAASGCIRLYAIERDGQWSMRVVSSSNEVGNSVVEVSARVSGEPERIGLSREYLRDILGTMSDGELSLELNGSSQAVAWRVVGDEGGLHVMMPMILALADYVDAV